MSCFLPHRHLARSSSKGSIHLALSSVYPISSKATPCSLRSSILSSPLVTVSLSRKIPTTRMPTLSGCLPLPAQQRTLPCTGSLQNHQLCLPHNKTSNPLLITSRKLKLGMRTNRTGTRSFWRFCQKEIALASRMFVPYTDYNLFLTLELG